MILPPLFRPDKPRIPFEDMDCKVTFQVNLIMMILSPSSNSKQSPAGYWSSQQLWSLPKNSWR